MHIMKLEAQTQKRRQVFHASRINGIVSHIGSGVTFRNENTHNHQVRRVSTGQPLHMQGHITAVRPGR